MRRTFILLAMIGISSAAIAAEQTASTKAYDGAMMKMHEGMDISYTGDADADFVASMIPHHQGAVDMAKIELQYGKDPEIRKLAEGVVAAQEKEIAFMQQWQAAHPAKK